IAILDNFCWGDCEKAETLGALVRAALACYDMAVALDTPFISGKDSLNNEFSFMVDGKKRSIAIPSTLLISAMGQVESVDQCVTMDFKTPGNRIYQVGVTRNELGGSHFALVNQLSGGRVPQVDPEMAKTTFHALHQAIRQGMVRSCHDLSEGGLAVALAEMAFAGGWGAEVELTSEQHEIDAETEALFSESNSRFLCEVPDNAAPRFEALFKNAEPAITVAQIGTVTEGKNLVIRGESGRPLIDLSLRQLKEAWKKPLDW
ncbi:MAG: AIR synthase-related protein, partial [Planctomycetota bacterium]|nr:AIR synthase-related protein [Planctomycetota bacterium]MEE2780874.1 AIR synthase-related protein [Planctomycetota bacterium]